MADSKSEARDAQRRRQIVDAARDCFLQFGYGKTSLDDIARRAGISRPLIYRKFKNKEEIVAGVFDAIFEAQYPAVVEALAGRGSRRSKLLRVYELLLLEPWDQMMGMPMAAELYDVCARLLPSAEASRERMRLKFTQAVLGDKELSELFMLAVDGLQSDLPKTAVLRRRVELLIERFI